MAKRPDVRYIHSYTDGSAAYKLEPVKPYQTAKLPRTVKRKRVTLYVDPVAVIGIVVAVVMLVLMFVGVVQLQAAQQQTAAMAQYVEALQQENQSLQAEYASGYDLEEIRRMAEALDMVPMEQVEHITIEMPQVQVQEEPSVWERFCTYLTGLFA